MVLHCSKKICKKKERQKKVVSVLPSMNEHLLEIGDI